jgi:hypothetical protein
LQCQQAVWEEVLVSETASRFLIRLNARPPAEKEQNCLLRVYKNEKEAGGGEFAIKFACSGSPEAAVAASAEPNALRLQLPAPGSLINRRARRNE